MTNQNQTSELEYCETCGTMLIMGICRRCEPELTRTNKAGHVTKRYTKTNINDSDNMDVHTQGTNFAANYLKTNDLTSIITNDQNISLIVGKKTILVRAMTNSGRAFLCMGSLNNLIADFLIIVDNVKSSINTKIYIIPMEIAKKIADHKQCKSNGINDYFINIIDYKEYKNNYTILN